MNHRHYKKNAYEDKEMPMLKPNVGDIVVVRFDRNKKFDTCDLVVDLADMRGYYPVLDLLTGKDSKAKWEITEGVEVH